MDTQQPAPAVPAVVHLQEPTGAQENEFPSDSPATLCVDMDELNRDLVRECKAGNCTRISALISSGADVETRIVDGYSPVMWAVLNGRPAAVESLLLHGADTDATSPVGSTALMLAAASRREQCTRVLSDAGASNGQKNMAGMNATLTAVSSGSIGVLGELLRAFPGEDRTGCLETSIEKRSIAGIVSLLAAGTVFLHE
jgi:ankyrin repeat protein